MAAKLTRLTHKIAIQLHLVAESCYHLQFSLQEASPENFGYTLLLKSGYQFQKGLDTKTDRLTGRWS
jgi:hypothetical protein